MSDALRAYTAAALTHLQDVVAANAAALTEAAGLVLAAWRADQLVYSLGSGHSTSGVVETFYRAGGLPFVRPLWHPDLLPLNGAGASTEAERRTGLGGELVTDVAEGDVLVVFSSSGINPVPVEAALAARDAGASVVAVTSRAASDAGPSRAGTRLYEVADVVLDTRVPPGDVTWPAADPRTAPQSSLANALLWNAVLVLCADAEPAVPFWRSANVGEGPSNETLLHRYGTRVPEL
ncbi:sugar isomerase domain-containing protein [Georgenia alba]|uniref:Sugar isomerase domain-containing protein n=1 Tax=Georgenia alba TaxID=2233858 RepID=A0ABW2QF25_9MICO